MSASTGGRIAAGSPRAGQDRDRPDNACHHLITRHLELGLGERTAYHFEGRRVSYAQLAEWAMRAQALLAELGVAAGDRVLSLCGDSPTLVAMVLGAWRLGAVMVVENQLSPRDHVRFLCEHAEPRLVISSAISEPRLRDAGVAPPRWLDRELASWLEDAGTARGDALRVAPDHPACWQYTQAEDGANLPVIHTHAGIVAGAEPFAIQRLALGRDDVCFSIAKLHFGFGFGNSLVFPLAVGASAILENGRVEVHATLKRIADDRPTVVFGVPTFYAAMVNIDDCASRYDLTSVRAWVSAGEELAATLARRFEDQIGAGLVDGIGSTELFHIWMSCAPGASRPGTLGSPTPGHDIELRGPTGAPVADGEVGDVWVRGPHNGAGYARHPERDRGKFEAGWIKSGDRMVHERNGEWRYIGRADGVVKVGGQKVVLAEVADRLRRHDLVSEVEVEAVTGEHRLVSLRAWLRLAPGVPPGAATRRALQHYLREHLLPHKCPSRYEFLPQRPVWAPSLPPLAARGDGPAVLSEGIQWMVELRRLVDHRLEVLLDGKCETTRRLAPGAECMVEAIRDLTFRGGKRLRPALLVAGYLAVEDAADLAPVLDAAAAAELFQSFLLIHDDWMDQDEARRGGKTVHVMMRERFRDAHVGASIAVLCGNLASAYAWGTLAGVRLPGDRVRRAVQEFLEIQEHVVSGQLLDIIGQGTPELMHLLKTASYTVRGPLRMGAILGGGTSEQVAALDRFADPSGLAFQLRDDLLGTFGDPAETGKSAGNDLRAGKQTALIAAARDRADPGQRTAIEQALGNAGARDDDIAAARAALEACGARSAVEAQIDSLLRQALAALDEAPLRPPVARLLRSIASMLVARKH